ncbi:MAG: hypothetical protein ACREJM_12330, partial [Candidatus Saccharimonadales bacterium]
MAALSRPQFPATTKSDFNGGEAVFMSDDLNPDPTPQPSEFPSVPGARPPRSGSAIISQVTMFVALAALI